MGGGFVGDLSIGGDGAGTVIVNGGNLITRFLYLGQSPHGHGIGTQTDGTFEVKRNFVMSELKPASAVTPTASNYTMSGGTLLIGTIGGGEMYIGAHGPATFTLSGNSSSMSIPRFIWVQAPNRTIRRARGRHPQHERRGDERLRRQRALRYWRQRRRHDEPQWRRQSQPNFTTSDKTPEPSAGSIRPAEASPR